MAGFQGTEKGAWVETFPELRSLIFEGTQPAEVRELSTCSQEIAVPATSWSSTACDCELSPGPPVDPFLLPSLLAPNRPPDVTDLYDLVIWSQELVISHSVCPFWSFLQSRLALVCWKSPDDYQVKTRGPRVAILESDRRSRLGILNLRIVIYYFRSRLVTYETHQQTRSLSPRSKEMYIFYRLLLITLKIPQPHPATNSLSLPGGWVGGCPSASWERPSAEGQGQWCPACKWWHRVGLPSLCWGLIRSHLSVQASISFVELM